MTKDHIKSLYLESDHNCAETVLFAISREYGLGLDAEDIKLVGAWGGGAGCGIICGALAGSLAALGKICITERAHATAGFSALCAAYVEAFLGTLGSTDCRDIKPNSFVPGVRCINTIEQTADLFDWFIEEHGIIMK